MITLRVMMRMDNGYDDYGDIFDGEDQFDHDVDKGKEGARYQMNNRRQHGRVHWQLQQGRTSDTQVSKRTGKKLVKTISAILSMFLKSWCLFLQRRWDLLGGHGLPLQSHRVSTNSWAGGGTFDENYKLSSKESLSFWSCMIISNMMTNLPRTVANPVTTTHLAISTSIWQNAPWPRKCEEW